MLTSFLPTNTSTSTSNNYTYPSPNFVFNSPAPSTSSMAVTVLIFLLVLLFIGFFSIFARRVFAWGAHYQQQDVILEVGGPHPPTSARYRRHHYLGTTAGLDPTVVSALPVLKYVAAADGAKLRRVGACVVCLGELDEGEIVKIIPGCGHVFHPGCIDGWLLLHASCPICRCSEVSVNLCGLHLHDEAAAETQDDGERKLTALGRSKSFGCSESSAATLQRSCSV